MNLAEMLCYADIRQLGKIADHYGCECDGHSKNDLIQAILSAIGRKACIDRFVESMSVEDIRFAATLLFEDKSGYSPEELTARARQARFELPKDEAADPSREMIAAYKHRGWLFNGISGQRKFLLQVPRDLKRKINASLEDRFRAGLERTGDPTAWRDEQSLIMDDILLMMRELSKEEFPLTAGGTIHKRQLAALLDKLSVKEEPVGRVGFRFGYGRRFREYPDRFSLMYDYCYFHGLISEDNGRLRLTEAGRSKVLGGQKEKLGQIYRLWIRLYKGPIPNVLPIANWVLSLSDQWTTVESLKRVLCPLIKPYYYDTPEAVLEQRIIGMLMHLGLLQIGEHPDCGAVVRSAAQAIRTVSGIAVGEEETIHTGEG